MKALAAAALCLAVSAHADPLKVGSKRFTESYILAEILVQTAGDAVHRPGLGNTGIVYAALKSGAIDLYPEYSGTIAKEILKLGGDADLEALNRALAADGLAAGVPLGFNDGYGLAMREERAQALGIRTISQLAAHPALKLGLSQEFLGRADGWPGLESAYRLPFATPAGLDHGLAYEAIAAGRIDVMDVYATDAKIAHYRLRVLEDDRKFFPRYDALLLYRRDVPARFSEAWARLQRLEGRIDERAMIRMNAAAELEGASFAQAASLFTHKAMGETRRRSFLAILFGPDLGRVSAQHLLLVFVSLAASIAAGIPLGVAAARWPRLAQAILGIVGVIQTIPALALLAFLIALVGAIGTLPALIALFLYALLPIVRNTHAGIVQASAGAVQAARALGLRPLDVLWRIELPLALPSILAGIKTSAVINVGTATIAAFIGAGGYGERIAAGLALNDSLMLLAGAVPAALLAILVQLAFEIGERRFAWNRRGR